MVTRNTNLICLPLVSLSKAFVASSTNMSRRIDKILSSCRWETNEEGEMPSTLPNVHKESDFSDFSTNGYLEVDVNTFTHWDNVSRIQDSCDKSDPCLRNKISNGFCNRGFACPEAAVSEKNNIIVHNTTIIKPADLEFNNLRNDNFLENKSQLDLSAKKNYENLENQSDQELSPEDPFHASSSDDSLYHPDSEEDSCSDDYEKPTQKKIKKLQINRNFSQNKILIENMNENIVEQNNHNSNFPSFSSCTDVVTDKKPYKRKPDHCYYCETKVLNFGRHVIRNHSNELEVAKILAMPIKSKKRRDLFNVLRRKGNFLAEGGVCFKSVREGYVPERDKLPCNNCLGYFSSKLLYRHEKKCIQKVGSENSKQFNIFYNAKVDRRLREEVLPRMRADKLSLEAQKDPLICEYGSRYLKTHREKHFVHVTSRKMRELTKILLEMRRLEPSITTFISALKPKYFDLFVEATKRIAKYNPERDIYLSPTFAMNIVTSLKQCCDIAITFIYTKNIAYTLSAAAIEADLKTLIRLFETNWSSEVSSQAANNLNLNKWNKVTIVPLASDLRLLRQHLINLAEESVGVIIKEIDRAKHTIPAENDIHSQLNMKNHKTIQAFNNLIETIYCRVILLNRKRSGELQRMFLHTYLNASTDAQKYEEFDNVVSLPEKVLLKSLKRVVIRGKRGKGVPVLFHSDIQDNIKTILEVRDYFVPKNNPYLFAMVSSSSHLIGYKILTKHAKLCGAQNPSSITSTRLRKHLATLSQLFNLSDGEIEQLATFMGHTSGVHRNSYRLPDDVYQTAKISKLLMVMEKGGADQYKGKSIDEIDIDMEENLLGEKDCDDDSDEDGNTIEDELLDTSKPSNSSNQGFAKDEANEHDIKSKKKNTRKLVPWTDEQKTFTLNYFKDYIKLKKPPKRHECEDLKTKYKELLNNKDWLKIKVYVQNAYTKGRK